MMPAIVDTHAHLDMDPFNKDLSQVIARAGEAGVSRIITVGIDLESSRQAIRLAEDHPQILATAGYHPHEVTGIREEAIAEIARLASHPKVVAIGEVGLDFYRHYSSREAQLRVLKWQLELAVRLRLPVIIHCRQADKDMIPLLRDWTAARTQPPEQPIGVIHCFSGDTESARQYLDMGFYIALGGYISYPSSRHTYNAIRSIPPDRLLVETDCPFLPPQGHRGQRNEPAYLPLTVKKLAEIRGVPPEIIARQTTQNAGKLLGRPKGKPLLPPLTDREARSI
ncbi:TatD family hydrolase [Chloroflexota bacterium]